MIAGDPAEPLDDGFTRTLSSVYSLMKRHLKTGEGSQYTIDELLQLADFRQMEKVR